ncbi:MULTISPECIES: MFS transporter [unclassified Novosphingobium]|uniref:MFS transporter n=1 Tax=unclassified Novosphingobium TaxID=2644732 RepID=UPI00146D661B|nr:MULTISPECIES: MFS transporter [unclassified Novosphingobium]NMN05935.1 MFS family permease [Novosphingobium sp. SG919]NMN88231.1 MFS family permease [Novosphingobium sp. SG916]
MDLAAETGFDTGTRSQKLRILAACACILCINAAFPIYGASVVNTAMVSEMKLDRSLLGLLVSANMMVTGLTAPLMGGAVGRFGAQRTLIFGSSALIGGSLIMAFLVHGSLAAIGVFGLIVGLAMSAGGFVANQACVAGWFVEDRARPFAVLYATMGAGGFVAAPVISAVIEHSHRWSAGWLVFTAVGCVALALSVFVVRDAPRSAHVVDFGPPGEGTGNGNLASISIWLIILCIMAAGASSSLYIAHGLAMLQDFGHNPNAAASSMSIMAASTLIGNFLIGAFGKKLGVRRILAAGSVTFALGLVMLANAHGTLLFYAYPPVLGAGFGAVQVGAMALLSRCTSPDRFAAISGVAISLQTIASAITPFLGGWMFDTQHTYMPLFAALVALNLVTAVFLVAGKALFPKDA